MSKSVNGFISELKYGDILERIKAKGYSEESLSKCIEEYEKNEMWILTANGSKLRWLMIDE